jgi:hypothetical protein
LTRRYNSAILDKLQLHHIKLNAEIKYEIARIGVGHHLWMNYIVLELPDPYVEAYRGMTKHPHVLYLLSNEYDLHLAAAQQDYITLRS